MTAETMNLSQYVAQLLEAPDSDFPELSFLQKQAHFHRSAVILQKECILIDSLRGQGKEDDGKKDEEIDEQFKFKIERGSRKGYLLRIFSPRVERMRAIVKAVIQKIDQWEQNKKFFKINDSQTPFSNSKDHGYDHESMFRLSARSIDLGASEADWPSIVHRLGLGHHKTDFAIAFQRHYHVLLFCQEGSKFRGIMIYGSSNNQRLAFIELGSLFNMHTLTRMSIPIENSLITFLEPTIRNEILNRLHQSFTRAELFLIPGNQSRSFAILYTRQGQLQEASEMLRNILSQYKSSLCTDILSPDFWVLRSKLQYYLLSRSLHCTYRYNFTYSPLLAILPIFVEAGVWKYKSENTNIYDRYSSERSKELQKYFKQGQDYFLLDGSNFSFPPGHLDKWVEQTTSERLEVKRETILVQDETRKLQKKCPSRGLVIRGFRNQLTQFKKLLKKKWKILVDSAQEYDLENSEINVNQLKEIEDLFEVKVVKTGDMKTKIVGIRSQEAFQALKQSTKQKEGLGGEIVLREIDPIQKQSQEVLKRLDYRKKKILVRKVLKYSGGIARARYLREKRYQAEQGVEKEVMGFTTVDAKKKQTRTFYESLESLLEAEIKNFKRMSEFKVVVWKLMLGKMYRAGRLGRQKWVIPPRYLKLQYQVDSASKGALKDLRKTSYGEELKEKKKGNTWLEDDDAEKAMFELMQYDTIYKREEHSQERQKVIEIQINPEEVQGSEYYDSVDLGGKFLIFNKSKALAEYLISCEYEE